MKKAPINTVQILYSDAEIVVANKPAGVLVLPDRYDPEVPVLVKMLEPEYGRFLVVHRLDKDTSGAILLARTAKAHRLLSVQFGEREVAKVYHALVSGAPEWKGFAVDLALRPNGDRAHRTVIDATGKPSRTVFTTLARYGRVSLIEARPETGRTHQVRVHLSSQGYPIICDDLYGKREPLLLSSFKRRYKGDEFEERPLLARLALHAFEISFTHPDTGKEIRIEAPYPKDFSAAMKQLAKAFGQSEYGRGESALPGAESGVMGEEAE